MLTLFVESLDSYFDGRKDKGTLVNINDALRGRQVTLVDQTIGYKLGFATPLRGSGK